MTTQTTRPEAGAGSLRCTIFRDGAATSAPASHETLSAALRDPETLVWLDLEEADKDHIAWVAQ
ncbi:MAG TPA: hypothetical protein VFJ94_14435, partial [Intrasporangium sp.]|uniref:hypothetical protein n=1 Tax=Intrasporangium sp. TaxID=1925024 RepID=UPI002D764E4E